MKKNVLIADDSAFVRKYVSLALKLSGLRVIYAEDGIGAWELLGKEKVDLLITDLNMPNMDGYTLVCNVRKIIEWKELPIIILSTLSREEDIGAGMSAGANSFLVKPFNAQSLQYEVSKYLPTQQHIYEIPKNIKVQQ